jgi:oligopeptide/dipeptide ABC transporter ATP-binding protein
VRRISQRVMVMYLGQVMEVADRDALFDAPQHPYTRALLSAIPVADPDAPRQRIVLDGKTVNRNASLREIAAGHWAAI